MDIQPILVPFANDVARWGAAKGPGAIMQTGLAEALTAAGHRITEPVEASLVRDRAPATRWPTSA